MAKYAAGTPWAPQKARATGHHRKGRAKGAKRQKRGKMPKGRNNGKQPRSYSFLSDTRQQRAEIAAKSRNSGKRQKSRT